MSQRHLEVAHLPLAHRQGLCRSMLREPSLGELAHDCSSVHLASLERGQTVRHRRMKRQTGYFH
jgi:hypothetical protein